MKKCVSKLKIFWSKNEDSTPAIDPVLLSVRQKPIEEFLGLPPVSNFEKIRSVFNLTYNPLPLFWITSSKISLKAPQKRIFRISDSAASVCVDWLIGVQ